MRALLLTLLLLAPLAAADHAFSHRLYVVGRVVDSDGLPAPGLPVNVTFEGVPATGRCFDSKEEVTGPRGDYEICRHAHVIPQDAGVTVRVAGMASHVGIDPELRHASVSFQLKTPTEVHDVNGERTFARTFLVTGRAFTLMPVTEDVEGVPVDAMPIYENVTVRLVSANETLAERIARPDEHGRYQAELDIEVIPGGTIVQARVPGARGDEIASPLYRRADVNLVRDLRLARGPGEDAPGSSPTPAPAWAAGAALAVAALAIRRRA